MTDNIREKLVELLKVDNCSGYGIEDCYECIYSECDDCYTARTADHLIANGVTVQTEDEKWNALNEAYDLGVDSVLHDHFGLSWDDAAELRKEVKRLQEATKWIPVTERLPEKGRSALVYFDTGNMAVGYWYDKDECISFWQIWTDDGWVSDADCEPIYWMPLPDAPKGE